MKLKIFRFFLSTSSFSGVILFLLIGKKVDVPVTSLKYFYDCSFLNWMNPGVLKYIIFIVLILMGTFLLINFVKKCLPSDDNISIKEIKPAEGMFLPVYIGLFVIALSFEKTISYEHMVLLLLLYCFWLFLEGVSYFNPFFLFFGYRFYETKSEYNTQIILITKRQDIKLRGNPIIINNLIRINNFTFLEK